MNDYKSRRLIAMLMGIALFFVTAALVAWLWNRIIPWVIGFPPITYWQAAGLLLLTRILFGGFGWIFTREYYRSCRKPVHDDTSEIISRDSMSREQKSEYEARRIAFIDESEPTGIL